MVVTPTTSSRPQQPGWAVSSRRVAGGLPRCPPPPCAGAAGVSRIHPHPPPAKVRQGVGGYWNLHGDIVQEALEWLAAADLKRVAFVCQAWLSYITTNPHLRAIVELHGLFAVGGWDGDTELDTAEFYSPSRDEWTPLPRMREKRSHVGCAVVDRKIYVIGGRDDERRLNTAEVYDPFSGAWDTLPPMSRNRSSLALRAVGNSLYAFGGYDGCREHVTNERYDIAARRWSFVAPLDSSRSQMASAAADEYVYLFGGCDNHGQRILPTAQRYNAVYNSFETLPDMHDQRLSGAATVLDGLVYVLGGSNGHTTHQSVECFDPRCHAWTRAGDLTLMRVNLSAATFEGTMIVVGGFHTQLNQLSCVEAFLPHTHPRYTNVLEFSRRGGRSSDGADLPRGAVPVTTAAGSSAPHGLWKQCRALSDARDAVNVCAFD